MKPCWNPWITADSHLSNLKEWSSYFTSVFYFPPYLEIPHPNETVEAVHKALSLRSVRGRGAERRFPRQQVSSSAFLCLFGFFHDHWVRTKYLCKPTGPNYQLVDSAFNLLFKFSFFLQYLHSQVLTRNNKKEPPSMHVKFYGIWILLFSECQSADSLPEGTNELGILHDIMYCTINYMSIYQSHSNQSKAVQVQLNFKSVSAIMLATTKINFHL